MRKLNITITSILLILLTSCEDVVDIDLNESEPRLVIEASIIWRTDTDGNNQFIKLSTTAPFFDTITPPATNARVQVLSDSGEKFLFNEVDPGIYKGEDFNPQVNASYTLTIQYKDETYTATEILQPVVELEEIVQSKNGGFNSDEYELKGYYSDPVEESNFYLFRLIFKDISLQIYDDEFTNGNRTFAYFSDEDLAPGDKVFYEIQGISEQFYNYLFILRSQAGDSNGGPFQTQPTTVRGNIINITNPDNFAFGYFRLSQSNLMSYEIK